MRILDVVLEHVVVSNIKRHPKVLEDIVHENNNCAGEVLCHGLAPLLVDVVKTLGKRFSKLEFGIPTKKDMVDNS